MVGPAVRKDFATLMEGKERNDNVELNDNWYYKCKKKKERCRREEEA